MSSVKRRKIEEDGPSTPLGVVKTKEIKNIVPPAPITVSASPEPSAQLLKETTPSDLEPQKDAPVQKTFKDLVYFSCSVI